jgi:hypothetical protein
MDPEADVGLIAELYETLARGGASISIHERLVDSWREFGELGTAQRFCPTAAVRVCCLYLQYCHRVENARGVSEVLLGMDPTNLTAREFLVEYRSRTEQRQRNSSTHRETRPSQPPPPRQDPSPSEHEELAVRLEAGYNSMRRNAEMLSLEFAALPQTMRGQSGDEDDRDPVYVLSLLQNGDFKNATGSGQPQAVSELARAVLEADTAEAGDIIADDFDEVVEWARNMDTPPDDDALRSRLIKRKNMLTAALGPEFKAPIDAAMASLERQIFRRTYENHETMLGDPVSEIPRRNFFVSEDNFAWDLEELVPSIQAQNGVMRNPLSRQMFSAHDIRRICGHPLGRCLIQLRQAQDQFRQGIHPDTITRVARLGRAMLDDQSNNIAPTLRAIDEFLAYAATLPQAEQDAIDSLKIPATDRHTNQPYDLTIGDCVRDVRANVVCSHKVSLVRLESMKGKVFSDKRLGRRLS